MAYAELIRRTPTVKVDPGLVQKMLLYFDDTRARDPGFDEERTNLKPETVLKGHGWFSLHDPKPHFSPTATLVAVNALAAINRMLDEKINQVVLAHFKVKNPEKDLDHDLDALFYPDYGIDSFPPKVIDRPTDPDTKKPVFEGSEWPEDFGRSESVAVTLQRMRAHIKAIVLNSDEPPRCSVVFHGPAGTGKTTFPEALAKSCGVPLVEVTPSDIIVGGEEAIERRARAVFEALTLLTRVVILFDEFDPVLWKRDPGDATPRSVFTFLTPAMLPKLKDLRRYAKKRSCAFALSTNLIGGLDPAAVREGRFDVKLGIYPPDPLSRAGRLLNQMDAYLDHEDVKRVGLTRPDSVQQRVLDVVKSTDGGAMETLAKARWFKAPKPGDATGLKDNRLAPKNGPLEPFAYLFNGVGGTKCKKVTREANLKDPVKDPTAILEFVQWWWIQQLDENLPSEIGEDEKFDDIFRKATSATHAKLMSELVTAGRRNQSDRTHDTSSRFRK
jgi:hypothetical protein